MSDPSLILDDRDGIVLDMSSSASQTFTGSAKPETFFVGVGGGADTIVGFGKNDLLVMKSKIFDSNNDGLINFGKNKLLDLDGTRDGLGDTINFQGTIKGLRYLGSDAEGNHAYADISVRKAGWLEGTLADDTLDTSGGNKTVLFDTALDLNWGKDTINNFGVGDRFLTTSKMFDSNDDGTIDFAGNNLLDLTGSPLLGSLIKPGGPLGHEGNPTGNSPWGQVAFFGEGGEQITALKLLDTQTAGTVTYYVYGLEAPIA